MASCFLQADPPSANDVAAAGAEENDSNGANKMLVDSSSPESSMNDVVV